MFVLFAPHVGISNTGRVGEYSRRGQSCDGKACGAACAALSYCLSVGPNATMPADSDMPYDHQQLTIMRELSKRLDPILQMHSHTDPSMVQVALAHQMFDIVRTYLYEILSTEFASEYGDTIHGRLILLGGIQINMPFPMSDYFLPLVFEVRRQNRPAVSIFDETFGGMQEEDCVRSRQLSMDALEGRADDHPHPPLSTPSSRSLLGKLGLKTSTQLIIPPRLETSSVSPSEPSLQSPRGGPDWEGDRENERRAAAALAAAAAERNQDRLLELLGELKVRLREKNTSGDDDGSGGGGVGGGGSVAGGEALGDSSVISSLEELLRLLQ